MITIKIEFYDLKAMQDVMETLQIGFEILDISPVKKMSSQISKKSFCYVTIRKK